MVRIGLVGIGPDSIGQRFYVPSLLRIAEAQVVAVASRSGASYAPSAPVYSRWEDMLERVPLDLLFVLAPTHVHRPIVMAAFERGIHVLCEKPPALTLADAELMVTTARSRGLTLLFGFNRRFAPTYLQLKQLSETRGCHTLVMQKTRRWAGEITPEKIMEADARWQVDAGARGTPIFEFVAHFMDLAIWINGPVVRSGFFPRTLYGSTVHLTSSGYLEHASGARTLITYDQLGGENREHVTLYGPAVTAQAGNGLFARTQLELADRGKTEVIMGPEDTLECSGFLPMCRHIIQCVAAGRPVTFDPADGIEALRLALACDPPIPAPRAGP
jgi:predicted dehydrogenase